MSLNTEHFAAGSQFPPLAKDKIRIYSMRFCPYVERAHLTAVAKNVPYEIINCNLKSKPEWLFEKNSAGKVPTVEIGSGDGASKILNESLIIADFFNEGFPDTPSLVSADPFQRAKDRMWMESFNKVVGLYFKAAYMTVDDGSLDGALEDLKQELGIYDKELQSRGTIFFGGPKAGMLDYMMWPWIERLPVLTKLYGNKFPLDVILKENATLGNWITEMKIEPAVAKVIIPSDVHYQYILSSRSGAQDYSLLDGVVG